MKFSLPQILGSNICPKAFLSNISEWVPLLEIFAPPKLLVVTMGPEFELPSWRAASGMAAAMGGGYSCRSARQSRSVGRLSVRSTAQKGAALCRTWGLVRWDRRVPPYAAPGSPRSAAQKGTALGRTWG